MNSLRVRPRAHANLQDWVAAEKGYFEDEGLDNISLVVNQFEATAPEGKELPKQELGAYGVAVSDPSKAENPEDESNVNTFCHWAVNMAVGGQHGKMWAHAYSWTLSGLYAAPDSNIETPEDLANVPIAVGLQSGSHFSTVLALEKYLAADQIKLQFVGGPNQRMGLLLDGRVQVANGLGCPCSILEQNGFRKIIDNSFIQGFLISGDVPEQDIAAYFRALRKAQRDIDLDAEPYRHYLIEHSVPAIYHKYIKNPAALAIPTRIVFDDYTKEMYEETRRWMDAHDFFDDVHKTAATTAYDDAMIT